MSLPAFLNSELKNDDLPEDPAANAEGDEGLEFWLAQEAFRLPALPLAATRPLDLPAPEPVVAPAQSMFRIAPRRAE